MSGQAKVSSALRVCQEVIAVLLAKEDEKLLRLVGTKLCDQLKELTKLIQDANCIFNAEVESEVESALSAFYGLHSTYFLGMCMHSLNHSSTKVFANH